MALWDAVSQGAEVVVRVAQVHGEVGEVLLTHGVQKEGGGGGGEGGQGRREVRAEVEDSLDVGRSEVPQSEPFLGLEGAVAVAVEGAHVRSPLVALAVAVAVAVAVALIIDVFFSQHHATCGTRTGTRCCVYTGTTATTAAAAHRLCADEATGVEVVSEVGRQVDRHAGEEVGAHPTPTNLCRHGRCGSRSRSRSRRR